MEKVVCVVEHENTLLVWKKEDKPWQLPTAPVQDNDPLHTVFSLIPEDSPTQYYGPTVSPTRILHVFHCNVFRENIQPFEYAPLSADLLSHLKSSHKVAFEKAHTRSPRLPLNARPDHRLIISLLGNVGAGKGTYGQRLSEEFGIPHISIGDLFRQEIREGTPIGCMIKAEVQRQREAAGVANEVAYGILIKELARPECSQGFILDGFPRFESQTHVWLNGIVRSDIYIPIYLVVNEQDIVHRIQKRLVCASCGVQVRNTTDIVCKICSGVLKKRDEDISEAVIHRRVAQLHVTLPRTVAALTAQTFVHIVSTTPQQDLVAKQLSEIVRKTLESPSSFHYAEGMHTGFRAKL